MTGPRTITFVYRTGPIKGAQIIDSATFPVAPGIYKWERHNFEICIPEDSVDPSSPPSTMAVYASTRGHYQLPDNTELISGVYWIICSQQFSEEHPVTLKLQHCARIKQPEQRSSLSFVTADCTQNTLPYKFKEITGGNFSTDSPRGTIQLSHFSAVGLILKRVSRWLCGGSDESEEEVEKECVVRTYYFPQLPNQFLIHIVITWNVDTFLQVCVCNHY